MLTQQREFQTILNGYDVDAQSDEQRIDNFKESTQALIGELYEALGEMGWKSWATSRHFNREAVQAELVDAWHFFMNLMLHAGMSPGDLYAGFIAKQRTNRLRQTQGYDGVSTKCPECKRARDDSAVECEVVPGGYRCAKTGVTYWTTIPA